MIRTSGLLLIGVVVLVCAFAADPLHQAHAAADRWLPQPVTVYQKIAESNGIRWTWLAATDHYLQSIRKKGNAAPLLYTEAEWNGAAEPSSVTTPLAAVQSGGIAADGDQDGLADLHNPLDALTALVRQMNGNEAKPADEDIQIALWNKFQSARAVMRIIQFEQLLSEVPAERLRDKAFPVRKWSEASYKDTWGGARGWGGRRTHEGTDLFARRGTAVQSTCYGIVEMVGWNNYGGWRVGIRDIENTYHYFAHLHGFAKGLQVGQLVKPGEIIGSVGNSGYGKPGTTGKFPPHLHFGMYRDRGDLEWAFNPYPSLRHWEKQARSNATAARRRQSSKR